MYVYATIKNNECQILISIFVFLFPFSCDFTFVITSYCVRSVLIYLKTTVLPSHFKCTLACLNYLNCLLNCLNYLGLFKGNCIIWVSGSGGGEAERGAVREVLDLVGMRPLVRRAVPGGISMMKVVVMVMVIVKKVLQ